MCGDPWAAQPESVQPCRAGGDKVVCIVIACVHQLTRRLTGSAAQSFEKVGMGLAPADFTADHHKAAASQRVEPVNDRTQARIVVGCNSPRDVLCIQEADQLLGIVVNRPGTGVPVVLPEDMKKFLWIDDIRKDRPDHGAPAFPLALFVGAILGIEVYLFLRVPGFAVACSRMLGAYPRAEALADFQVGGQYVRTRMDDCSHAVEKDHRYPLVAEAHAEYNMCLGRCTLAKGSLSHFKVLCLHRRSTTSSYVVSFQAIQGGKETPMTGSTHWLGLAAGLASVGWGVFGMMSSTGAQEAVREGQPAPAISLPATQIDKVLPEKKGTPTLSLADFKGRKNVVLFFFPKAMTRGCTLESCGFRDRIEQFAQVDTVVIGISTDTLKDQQAFTKKEKLNFPLMADADKVAAKAFGVLNPNGFARRVTFVIDKDGVVRKIFEVENIGKHPDEVYQFIKEHLASK